MPGVKMATVTRIIAVALERASALLAAGWSYGNWVTGALVAGG